MSPGLKQEEEEMKAREGSSRKITSMGKGDGPDLKSFIQQLPVASKGEKSGEASEATSNKQKEKEVADQAKHEPDMRKSSSKKACYTCSHPVSDGAVAPNLSLRSAVHAFRREEESQSHRASKKRFRPDQDRSNYGESVVVDHSRGRGVQYPFSVHEHVIIQVVNGMLFPTVKHVSLVAKELVDFSDRNAR